jgi:hypothetical protein
MARILYTAIVGHVSGGMAGNVFKGGKGGNIIQNTPRIKKTASALQLQHRSKVQELGRKWRTLTEAQRQQWKEAAAQLPFTDRLGQNISLSAFNLYMKRNIALLSVGLTGIVTPTDAAPAALQFLDAGIGSDGQEMDFPVWGTFTGFEDSNSYMCVAATPPRSFGLVVDGSGNATNNVKNVEGTDVFMAKTQITSGVSTETQIKLPYAERFGIIPVGSTVSIFCWSINRLSGIESTPWRIDRGVFDI